MLWAALAGNAAHGEDSADAATDTEDCAQAGIATSTHEVGTPDPT